MAFYKVTIYITQIANACVARCSNGSRSGLCPPFSLVVVEDLLEAATWNHGSCSPEGALHCRGEYSCKLQQPTSLVGRSWRGGIVSLAQIRVFAVQELDQWDLHLCVCALGPEGKGLCARCAATENWVTERELSFTARTRAVKTCCLCVCLYLHQIVPPEGWDWACWDQIYEDRDRGTAQQTSVQWQD